MAGFFSPGLGFASGVGAFIGGAAQEGNRLLNEQRAQDRQDDILWQNKFERGLAEYNKEKKETDQKAQMYNNFLRLSGGNKTLADTAMNHVLINPKGYEDAVQMITTQKDNPAYRNDPGQSSYLDSLQSGLSGKYQHLDQLRQNVSPKAQRFMQMPEGPQGYGGGQQQASPFQSPQAPMAQPGQPSMVSSTPGQSDNPTVTPQGATPQLAGGPPDQMVNQPKGPQAAPIPPGQVQQPQVQPTQGYAPAGPGQGLYGGVIKPETKYQQEHLDILRQNQQLQREKFDLDKQRKPETFQEKADMDVAIPAAKMYLDDPKNGLQVRHTQLPDFQSQLNDINGIAGMLNNGLKSNATQPMWDELNRFTTATLGLDLAKAGISNTVSDTQLLKKEVANAMIDRLKTLHFGRITNYTENIVKQGMPSTSNDPNTNIKISLAIKSTIESAIKGNQIEYQTAFGTPTGNPTLQSVGQARLAAQNYINDYMKQHEGAPWLQMNINDPKKIPALVDLSKQNPGMWFENTEKGGNGKMYRVLGPTDDNMFLRIQDVNGKLAQIPIH